MKEKCKKAVIAAGGTGGHLFPAQAVALELQEKMGKERVHFMGKGLSSNLYFYREMFSYHEIASSPFSVKKILKTLFLLGKGTYTSFKLLGKIQPSVVIGFGSYHTFPVLAAALLRRVPVVLFESNAVPGKINRLFAPWARFCAIQFLAVKQRLPKTTCYEISMPLWRKEEKDRRKEAFAYFALDPQKPVLLVFGGSQGATSINQKVVEALTMLKDKARNWQVIHLVGLKSSREEIAGQYQELGISAVVKPFEDNMQLAWQIAEGVICRSGAATFAELITFAVPSILIPYPHASENHQLHNAVFMQERVKGGIYIEEKQLSGQILSSYLEQWMTEGTKEMRKSIQTFRSNQSEIRLTDLIEEHILSYE